MSRYVCPEHFRHVNFKGIGCRRCSVENRARQKELAKKKARHARYLANKRQERAPEILWVQ